MPRAKVGSASSPPCGGLQSEKSRDSFGDGAGPQVLRRIRPHRSSSVSMDWADVPVRMEGTELPKLPDRHTLWPVVRPTLEPVADFRVTSLRV